MSKMLRLELVGLVLLACTQILTEHRDFYGSYNQYDHQRHQQWQEEKVTREVHVEQGRLRGIVVRPRTSQELPLIDVFLGVPYAEPPVGSFRFSPPRSPQPWTGLRQCQHFAPVCPQVLPDLRAEVKPGRYEYLERLLPYLRNQSEDCLYLNIYAPHQREGQRNLRRYPVMVFIHGESFEWNSGNPYDGSVLTAYGNVLFVTINFRLGILGFLRPGIRDDAASNFGLLDQIAALVWLQENIAEFGGDPNSITLVGHGTGAIFANLLLISPVANNEGLFNRAILMSGSALSADAIGKAPLQITKQVAYALNCPTVTDSELVKCLRNRDLESLLNVKIHKPKYVPAYAPLIDSAVIPGKPLDLMENTQLFGRFDLMYGVTESEKFHNLPPVAVVHGMLNEQRDEILRDHAKATHELEPELVLSKVLEHYGDFSSGFTNEYATKNREIVLEALSDSGTVAPLVMTANLHSKANPKSYMYVFSHPKAMQDYSGQQRQRTVHGEELAYVLGVPLDGGKYHLRGRYNIGETLFAEAMMMWWCNFAHTGNPNAPRRSTYLTDGPKEWLQYEIDWPEYDPENQTYFNLTIPPEVGVRYRANEMLFWNEYLPNLIRHPNLDIPAPGTRAGPRPEILDIADGVGKYANGMFNVNSETNTLKHSTGKSSVPDGQRIDVDADGKDSPGYPLSNSPSNEAEDDVRATTPEPSGLKSTSAISMVIGFGLAFLLINLTVFFYLYRKRHALKSKEKNLKRRLSQKDDGSKRAKLEKLAENAELGYRSDSKPDLTELIKNDKAYDNNSNFGRRSKLSRQNSGSTIDTHIKVREWIQQEIVHRCSPRFLRKTRETLQKEHQEKLTKQQEKEERLNELEKLKDKKDEPIYDESPALIVRPGKKSKLPKVSVAIDATPATRTESILNQIPIELVKDGELSDVGLDAVDAETIGPNGTLITPQVIVIEHHHSKSDPLPMENVLKNVKPHFSSPKIYESDSGSASSLYAKINPKMKSRLPRMGPIGSADEVSNEAKTGNDSLYDQVPPEDPYGKTVPKLTTFGSKVPSCDINVTCREPTAERESVSPEEALKTIKRRKYPKVLPDIEKRRSLPVPNSLFIPKQHGNSLKDYKNNSQPTSPSGHPPLPPPRIFGTTKSLDLAEESEVQNENEPITTNLHVGPLLKRENSTRNNSDPSIIENFESPANTTGSYSTPSIDRYRLIDSPDGAYSSSKCSIRRPYLFPHNVVASDTSLNRSDIVGSSVTNSNWYKSKDMISSTDQTSIPLGIDTGIGNPNWYRQITEGSNENENFQSPAARSMPAITEPQIMMSSRDSSIDKVHPNYGGSQNWDGKGSAEPKIVITPRVGNLLGQSGQNLSQMVTNLTARRNIDQEPKIVITPKHEVLDSAKIITPEPKIVITPRVEPGFNLSSVQTPLSHVDDVCTIAKQERKEPKIIITPKDPKTGSSSNLKQPKIIIKPTTNPSKSRDNKNIPKVSAIPPPECQNFQNKEKDQVLERDFPYTEKPPLKEKPKVTRIPSFSKRKDESQVKAEKSSSPVYAEKTEIIQIINAIPTDKAINVPLIPTLENKSGIPTLLKKDSEKSSSTDSSASTTNSSNSNTGTIKRKPTNKK
ncbi:uncharacterized protein LOC107264370 [Cephus cinctus]|uniref:Uncharacterized protein LOC107264370 n=1 Tax=Cephus cinctus TaxID=211228 RepID=A0AAJ7R9U4_CEPCN|nr:uncharacterized protein LOC107264370 [Cephus cinctus]